MKLGNPTNTRQWNRKKVYFEKQNSTSIYRTEYTISTGKFCYYEEITNFRAHCPTYFAYHLTLDQASYIFNQMYAYNGCLSFDEAVTWSGRYLPIFNQAV